MTKNIRCVNLHAGGIFGMVHDMLLEPVMQRDLDIAQNFATSKRITLCDRYIHVLILRKQVKLYL